MRNKPLATPEYEERMKKLFAVEMAPEEYAARRGHQWGSFSGSAYRYRDPVLQDRIERFFRAMTEPGALERYRKQCLSSNEIEQIRKDAQEIW
jgi:hypothetical protein